MEETEPHKSRAALWAIIVAATVLLYALSTGPVLYLCLRYSPTGPTGRFVTAFYWPLTWLYDHGVRIRPLDAYNSWWVHRAMPPPPAP